jgi:PBSX family phage terminase large subunit
MIKEGNREYKPYGAADQLLYDKSPELLLSGPAGTGKSRACLEKVHICASKYPGIRCLIVRKTRSSCTESVLVTYEDKVLPESSPIKNGAERVSRHSYHYSNGSTIVVGGMDKATRIMSTEYDMIYVPEATELSENDWESLNTMLRNGKMPYQQLIADCNPEAPTHWLNVRCLTGKTKVYESRHEDNPSVTSDYLSKLDALTGVRYLRLRKGIWAAAEGLVYETYDPQVHLINPFTIPSHWTRIRSIDFGYTNPFVCQWWAFDNDGRAYRYRELYMSKRLVEDHAKQIKLYSGSERITATYADHDAEDRATLERHGIRTIAADKAISAGIQEIQSRLKVQKDGKARVFLFRDALIERDKELFEAKKPTCTEEEITSYIWLKPANGKLDKDIPVDLDNHGLDAFRYAMKSHGKNKIKMQSSTN